MNAATTSRRWIGRILATTAVTAAGIGLTQGVAAAAPAEPLPMSQPVSPAGSQVAPAQPTQVIDPDTAASVRSSWEARGRPNRMVIVRDFRMDLVTNGRLTRQVGHNGGPVGIADLDRALPASWLSVDGDTAVLSATVVLVRGIQLEFGGPGSTLRTLQLAGGAAPADAASIHTGGGRVALNGITVTSVDPATGQPLPATAAGRPSLVASSGGRLDVVDATIGDLGAAAVPTASSTDDGTAAIEYRTDSTGSLVRTNVARATVGVELARAQGVHLEEVTVSESAGDGLVFSGDQGTTMSGIRADSNAGNGVLVTGNPTSRPIGGITTNANGAFGVVVVGQDGIQVSGVATVADGAGGLRLSRSTDVTVADFQATDQRIGIFTHVNSGGIVLDGVHTTGGSRGLVTEKSTKGLEARNSSFAGARVAGTALDGADIALTDVQVSDSRAGVRVERGAHDIRLTGLAVQGGRDGIVTAPATTGLVISDLTVDYVESDAVRTFSPGARITGTRITGGTTGIDVAAGATITETTITAAEEGIHSRSPELVYASGVNVDTMDLGVNSAPGSPFTLVNSSVHALESVRGVVDQRGVNDLSLPPLNLLGAIGVPLIVLAIVMEELHTARQRRLGTGTRRRRPPLPTGAA
jgi:Right handed beta helix region